jgi:hypothetical protein
VCRPTVGSPVPNWRARAAHKSPAATDPEQQKAPPGAGLSERAAEGTRTLDLLHGKQTL